MKSSASESNLKGAVSVIVPAYNAEAWLGAALDSVIAQGDVVRECVVIDDGSTDSTLEMALRYAEQFEIFKVKSIPNSGVSVARNTALEIVSGDWLVFLDADDELLPGSVCRLLENAIKGECDIVEGAVITFRSEKDKAEIGSKIEGKLRSEEKTKIKTVSGECAAEWSLYQTEVNSSLYAKIYRSALWKGIKLPVGEIYEDLSVFYKIALRASTYMIIDTPVYLYREREDSQIHSFSIGRLIVLDVTERICNDFRSRLQEEATDNTRWCRLLKAATDRRLAACFNMAGLLMNNRFEGSDAILDDCLQFIRKNSRASLFNSNARLKNRMGAMVAMLLPDSLLKKLLRKIYI